MSHRIQLGLVAVVFFIAGIFSARFFEPAPAPVPENKPGRVSKAGIGVMPDHKPPRSMKLCGEPVPLDDPRAYEMLDREFNITVWDRAQVVLYLKRAGRYFPFIEQELSRAGLPDDLKYLAVAESALITRSQSTKGARGPWQFMTVAARSNGLRKNRVIDERYNFELSTWAAIKNLKRLKKRFGTWSLAMAAYNGGETRLAKAIKKQKTDNYYRLDLPLETERYNFRIAAIKIVMENPEKYGYRLSPDNIYQPQNHDLVKLTAMISVDIMEIAPFLESDFKEIKELNPQFLKDRIPPGSHLLRVPPGQGAKLTAFQKNHPSKLSEVTVLVSHRKQKKDLH